ncbi:MAG: methyltransferase domain-containing protein [Gammaproteobacteria bacterium]|nr:methyltransferase domain-containing protein [Gammaproteobacteria bacterium]
MKMWESLLGQQALRVERAALASVIRRMHGDVALWCGSEVTSAEALSYCMVRCPVFIGPINQSTCAGLVGMATQLEALPFRSNSIDGIILHHALELTSDPRVALREVCRVLSPGGRLIIVGFNPWSLLGIRRLYAHFFNDSLSNHCLINPLRLFDWLTLLGFELDEAPIYCGYGLPINRWVEAIDLPALARRESSVKPALNLPCGGILIASAIKQSVSMNLRGPVLGQRRRLAPIAYPRIRSSQRLKP